MARRMETLQDRTAHMETMTDHTAHMETMKGHCAHAAAAAALPAVVLHMRDIALVEVRVTNGTAKGTVDMMQHMRDIALTCLHPPCVRPPVAVSLLFLKSSPPLGCAQAPLPLLRRRRAPLLLHWLPTTESGSSPSSWTRMSRRSGPTNWRVRVSLLRMQAVAQVGWASLPR